MRELVEFLARSLVDSPDLVEVKEIEGDRSVTFEVRVAPGDMGKIIGKQGRIVRAIRTVVKAASLQEGKKALVEIIE